MNVGEVKAKFILDMSQFTPAVSQINSGFDSIQKKWTILSSTGAVIKSGIVEPLTKAADAVKTSIPVHEKAATSIKQAWQGMSIAVASALYIFNTLAGYIQKIVAFGEAGAKVERTEQAFAAVAKQAGLMGDVVIAGLQKSSKGMMDASDIMGKAGRLIQENISVATLNSIMESLAKQAPVVGDTLPEAWDKFGDALSRGTLRAMKAYVGMVDMEEEYRKYARSLGIATSALSDEHKQMVMADVVASRLKEQVKGLGQEHLTASERIAKAKASLKDSHEEIQKKVIPVVTELYEWWAKIVNIGKEATGGKIFSALITGKPPEGWKRPMGMAQEMMEGKGEGDISALFAKKPEKIPPKAVPEEYLEGLKKMSVESRVIWEGDFAAEEKLKKDIVNLEYDKHLKTLMARKKLGFESTQEEKKGLADLNIWKANQYEQIEKKSYETKMEFLRKDWEADAIYTDGQLELKTETAKTMGEDRKKTVDDIRQNAKDAADAELKINYDKNQEWLALLTENARNQYEIKKDFNLQYNEIGKTSFDIERINIPKQAEIWEKAQVDKGRIAEWTANKLKNISRDENAARLGFYEDNAGKIAGTFQKIAQAGGKHSESAFRMYQGFAIVEAGMGAAKAIVLALGSPPGPPYSYITAAVTGAMAATQIAMIAAAKPPTYDEGGVSNKPGIYYSGVPEAHIPLKSGRVPVDIAGGGTYRSGNTFIIHMENPTFQDQESQMQVMTNISAMIARQVATDAVIENYENDGPIRQMIRRRM